MPFENFTVYSKDGCPYCDKIENLMQFERLVVRIKKLKGVESVMRESGIKHNDISEKVFDHIENFSDT